MVTESVDKQVLKDIKVEEKDVKANLTDSAKDLSPS